MRKDILIELDYIYFFLNKISCQLMIVDRVCTAELEDAQRLGLQGNERIVHYNDWMRKYGLDHLCVD